MSVGITTGALPSNGVYNLAPNFPTGGLQPPAAETGCPLRQAWAPHAQLDCSLRQLQTCRTSTEYLGKWLTAHVVEANMLRLPLLLEEFGKRLPRVREVTTESLSQRDHLYRSIFEIVQKSIVTCVRRTSACMHCALLIAAVVKVRSL